VEHIPGMHETLGFVPDTENKKLYSMSHEHFILLVTVSNG
jgi:hypothetical protein